MFILGLGWKGSSDDTMILVSDKMGGEGLVVKLGMFEVNKSEIEMLRHKRGHVIWILTSWWRKAFGTKST